MTSEGPNPTPPTAPPTRQGTVQRVTRPMEVMAIWAFSIGALGILIPPLALAGIVLGIVAIRRVRRRAGAAQGTGLAVAGICCGGFGIVASVFYVMLGLSLFQTLGRTRMMVQGAALTQVHRSANTWASGHGGVYPKHVALLATGPNPTLTHEIVNLRDAPDVSVTVGSFDFAEYDGAQDAQDRIIAAVAALPDDLTWYRFGVVNFVRLDQPVGDSDLVFAWYHPADIEFIWLVNDDGQRNSIHRSDWEDTWARDAEARVRRGLPPFDPPALD